MTGKGSIGPLTKLVDHGRPEERFNILIVSEGYIKDRMDTADEYGFHNKAQEIVKGFLTTPPYDELWNGINLYRLDVFSNETGADIPMCTDPAGPGVSEYVDTYFDASYCTLGVWRLLDIDRGFLNLELKRLTTANVLPTPIHLVLVIVDGSFAGGSGGVRVGPLPPPGVSPDPDIAVFSNRPDFGEKWMNVVLHEMGHSIANLADEYGYYGGCGGRESLFEKYTGPEPSRPNATSNKDPLTIKWKKWISKESPPLPTKSNPKCSECDKSPSSVPLETIGAFEGADHYRCGIFRPRFDCIMRSTESSSFCPVCSEAIRSVIARYVPQPELIVFHIDNPPGGGPRGENQGLYRIGWNLDINGNILRGWGPEPPLNVGNPYPWFGADSQGGGIAVADVDGNGKPDLVVFHIDNRVGGDKENKGYYRIGWNLDVNGVLIGDNATHEKWSKPIEVGTPTPWFGEDSQGGGIAVADVDGNGKPDLVVFHIDNPTGDEKENKGYYRIGWNLDGNGELTGKGGTKWSPPIEVEGWFGEETSAGDIAVADVDGNGKLDLIVFHIDNPKGENKGYYRIGWNLDGNGELTGKGGAKWSPPIEVGNPTPWFGYDTHGGGIAVADVDLNGRPDLIVFHIDHPPGGGNRGIYRIGWNLDVNGLVTGDATGKQWSPPTLIPGWFGDESQAGDIALLRFPLK